MWGVLRCAFVRHGIAASSSATAQTATSWWPASSTGVPCNVLPLRPSHAIYRSTRDCHRIRSGLSCVTLPIVESSTAMHFACLQAYYFQLAGHITAAGLSPYNNSWARIHDFTPNRETPNWTLQHVRFRSTRMCRSHCACSTQPRPIPSGCRGSLPALISGWRSLWTRSRVLCR